MVRILKVVVLCFSLLLLLFHQSEPRGANEELEQAVFMADVGRVRQLLNLDSSILSIDQPQVFVNLPDKIHNRTALMSCAFDPQKTSIEEIDKDCREIASLLHKAGAVLEYIDKYGMNAVSIGASRGFTQFCYYLIENGASFDLPELENRTTPLMRAALNGYTDTFGMLLKNGANATLLDRNGLSAIHYATIHAMKSKSVSSMEAFLRVLTAEASGSDLLNRARDKDGRTALMYATIDNNPALVQVLVAADADTTLTDGFGVSTQTMSSDPYVRGLLQEGAAMLSERRHKRWEEAQDAAFEAEHTSEIEIQEQTKKNTKKKKFKSDAKYVNMNKKRREEYDREKAKYEAEKTIYYAEKEKAEKAEREVKRQQKEEIRKELVRRDRVRAWREAKAKATAEALLLNPAEGSPRLEFKGTSPPTAVSKEL